MEERIIRFITALRASGVRVSLAESGDAFGAIDLMGVQDRETFRLSLQATLIKEASDIPTFEELFPLFFDTAEAPSLVDPTQDLTSEEANMLARALRQFNRELRQMLEKLLRGEQLSQGELDQLGWLAGLDNAHDLRYRRWMARRMEQALQFDAVREATDELMELLAQLGMQRGRVEGLRQAMQDNLEALREQLNRHAGQRIADNISQRPDSTSIESLLHRPFGSLSEWEMDRLRQEVRRLATVLRSRVALRQKRAKTGQLDAKATIRANLKHGNVPIEIKYRDRYRKPRLVIICDVSTSMRPCSELMLSLIYAMQDQISKTRAFAFIDHLQFISPDFQGRDAREAVGQVLERMPAGYYNTDLGHSLEDFAHDYLDTVDGRTTFIIVGDGRNNYNNPQIDLFRKIARRSNRTLWLNPESPVRWGTGDSDMGQYAPHCDVILQVRTLAELTTAVDRLLSQS